MLNKLEFTISLIRHGQSEVNARPDEMGQSADVPLTSLGIRQACLLNERLFKTKEVFHNVYASPYVRAFDTAQYGIAGLNDISIEIVPELREYDAGDWTGGSRSTTLTDDVRARMGYLNHSFLPPNGESLSQVERRASKWLEDRILFNPEMAKKSQELKEHGQRLNIAVFSHGMTIKSLLHYIIGFDKSFTWKIIIDNTSITKLSFGEKGWSLHCINDCAHLLGAS